MNRDVRKRCARWRRAAITLFVGVDDVLKARQFHQRLILSDCGFSASRAAGCEAVLEHKPT
jgi:hypothetical protein